MGCGRYFYGENYTSCSDVKAGSGGRFSPYKTCLCESVAIYPYFYYNNFHESK